MQPRTRAIVSALVLTTSLTLLAGLSFCAGYVSARLDVPMPGLGIVTSWLPPSVVTSRGDGARLGVLLEAWRIVSEEYYDQRSIDVQKMTYGAIRGMLATLEDPHTTIADPERARQQSDDIRGSFGGIGIALEIRSGRAIVSRVVPDAPAAAAGVREGDALLRIDEVELRDPAVEDLVAKIRGPRGTTVVLTLARAGEAEPRRVIVTRGEIRTAPIRTRVLPGGIVYLQLTSFSGAVSGDLAANLARVLDQHPTGVVVDLRNNPGGLVQSAVDVASQFLRDGVVVWEQRRDREMTALSVKRENPVVDLPLVVLVNRGSASAAEIVAGALQDRGRAVLIGEPTYGKDSVQNVHQLSDRSSLRVTFARWYTPARQPIAGRGLTPDLLVPLSEDDRRAGRDPQLDRAVDYLQTRLARAG